MTIPPLQSEAQARALPAVAAIYARLRETPSHGVLLDGNLEMLLTVLHDGRVAMDGHDRRIAAWLCGLEPTTVAVVCGWVERAYASGLAAAEIGDGGGEDGDA